MTDKLRIKALDWKEITAPREDGPREATGEFEAVCAFGIYSVVIDADEDMSATPYCAWSPEDNLGHYASPDEAKDAANEDYAARRSALESCKEISSATFDTLEALSKKFPDLGGYYARRTGGADLEHFVQFLAPFAIRSALEPSPRSAIGSDTGDKP